LCEFVDRPVFAQWTGNFIIFSFVSELTVLRISTFITKLSDKCFYAAKITQRDPVQTGKWTVKFEDGQSRSLVEEFILPVSLLNKHQPVLVLNEDLSEGRPGVIIGYSKIKPNEPVEKVF
jgi:hypothetical protein